MPTVEEEGVAGSGDVPVLPPGGRLLHIGFHKTGTTALQTAFAKARKPMREAGIRYPGSKQDHHHKAALAVNERVFGWPSRGGVQTHPKEWDKLVNQVSKAPDRAVISSEFFSEAQPEVIERVIGELGGRDRVRVVATLRGFDRLLPSSWQQHLKSGMRHPYARWLRGVLADPPVPTMSPSFWRRHDHPTVLRRWVDVAGPENLTVVVLDETDRSMMYRVFEQMLGLPPELLASQPRSRTNRSLTAAEAELLRRVNLLAHESQVDWAAYAGVIRYGAVRRFTERREPSPDEQPILTPKWALKRAAEIGAREADEIGALGVNVIGDLRSLGPGKTPVGRATEIPTELPMDAAVEALAGALSGKLGAGPYFRTKVASAPLILGRDDKRVADVPGRELLKVAFGRLRHRRRAAAAPASDGGADAPARGQDREQSTPD